MASTRGAILVTEIVLILVGWLLGLLSLLLLLLRRRGWWARTPWSLLLRGGIVMVSLGRIGLRRRNDSLTGKRLEIRVSRVIGLQGIRDLGNGREGRLGVLRLMVGVVWIRPRLVLRWGWSVERLTGVGLLREIGMGRERGGRGRVVLRAGGRVRILILRVIGSWWIVLNRWLARRVMVRDTGTAKDGFVGGESLVRLSWTEWSVHHSMDQQRA